MWMKISFLTLLIGLCEKWSLEYQIVTATYIKLLTYLLTYICDSSGSSDSSDRCDSSDSSDSSDSRDQNLFLFLFFIQKL